MISQALKFINAKLATIALAGSGVGIGIVFAALITAIARNPSLGKQLLMFTFVSFFQVVVLPKENNNIGGIDYPLGWNFDSRHIAFGNDANFWLHAEVPFNLENWNNNPVGNNINFLGHSPWLGSVFNNNSLRPRIDNHFWIRVHHPGLNHDIWGHNQIGGLNVGSSILSDIPNDSNSWGAWIIMIVILALPIVLIALGNYFGNVSQNKEPNRHENQSQNLDGNQNQNETQVVIKNVPDASPDIPPD